MKLLRSSATGRILAACACLLQDLPDTSAADLRFPADAGIVDVTQSPYNAVGNGVADDTLAIKSAINAAFEKGGNRYSASAYVYFPKGTYRLTSPIESRSFDLSYSNGWRAGMILVGESRTETILKLDSGLPAFQDPVAPLGVIKTGSEDPGSDAGGNRAFRHSIHNLTVDIGANNPGAIGIDYITNNRGSIEDVLIRSSDSQKRGHIGLSMRRYGPGPGMVKQVEIDGFATGIDMRHHNYGMVFEHLTLRNQSQFGIRLIENNISIRGLTSVNQVPVLRNDGNFAVALIVNGNFSGGLASNPAIQNLNGANLFIRDTQTSGYGLTVDSSTSAGDAGAGFVSEYSSHGTEKTFPESLNTSLRLPVEETPVWHTNDFTKWKNVLAHGATTASGNDDAAGIQAAIDAAGPDGIVYLPPGDYSVGSTIILRGNLRKLVGMRAGLKKTGALGAAPLLRFDGGSANAVILEELYMIGEVVHNSAKALVLRHCDIEGYENTAIGTGKLFLEDMIGKPYHIRHPQKVWARQLNCEFGDEPLIVNLRGDLWILGYKTEGEMTVIENRGGDVELLGAQIYPLSSVPSGRPMIINDEGNLSATWKKVASPDYPIRVREKRGGLWQNSAGGVSTLREPLYVGRFNDAAHLASDVSSPTKPTALAASPISGYASQLTWNSATDDTRLVGYDIFRNGQFVDFVTGTSYTDHGLSPATTYIYTVETVDVAERRSGLSVAASATTPSVLCVAEYLFTASSLASTDLHAASTTSDFADGPGIVGGTGFGEGGRLVNQTVLTGDYYNSYADQNYFSFTVTPPTGSKLNVQKLEWSTFRYGSSPDTITVTCSADGYADKKTVTVDDQWVNWSWDRSEDADFQHLAGPVTFRFYFHGQSAGGTNTARKSFIDNVRLHCIVGNSPLPPPVVDTLAFYAFDQSVASSDTHSQTTAGDLTTGPGLTGAVRFARAGRAADNTALDSSVTAAIAEGDYLSFTVTPQPGQQMNLSELRFETWRTTSTPDRVRVYSSVDNYVAFLEVSNPSTTPWLLSAKPEYQNLAVPVTFRFYFYGTNSGADAAKIVVLDSVKLLGTTGTGAVESVDQAVYNFTGSNLNSIDADAASVAGSFASGAGYTSTAFSSDTRLVNGAGTSGASVATNVAAGEYFKFTLLPAPGKQLYGDLLSFKAKRAGASPDRVTVHAVPQGGPLSGQSVVVLNNQPLSTSFASFSVNLDDGSFDALGGLEIRLIFHGNNQGTGSNALDDVVLSGASF